MKIFFNGMLFLPLLQVIWQGGPKQSPSQANINPAFGHICFSKYNSLTKNHSDPMIIIILSQFILQMAQQASRFFNKYHQNLFFVRPQGGTLVQQSQLLLWARVSSEQTCSHIYRVELEYRIVINHNDCTENNCLCLPLFQYG